MSHIVSIATEVRDAEAVRTACRRLGLGEPAETTTQFFSGEATGLAVELPGWRYPVVCQTEAGTLHYDNYEGRWGDQRELDRFLQAYSVEKTRLEARRQGYGVTEHALTDGSIKLTVNVGESP